MKRFLTIAVTAFLCCLLAVPCFAAGAKPAVEVMWTDFSMNSVGGVSPQIWYRSNSDKPIKYIEWHLTAYNAVGDPVKCDIRNRSSIIAETVGPIYKTVLHSSSTTPYTKTYCADDDPFKTSYYTGYYINTTNPALYHNGSDLKYTIDMDSFGNYYASGRNLDETFLSADEIANAVYKDYSYFEICWYNFTIADFRVTKAEVIFMDGSKTVVSGNSVYSPYFKHDLDNKPFTTQVNQYSDVYNYKDYLNYNPDLNETSVYKGYKQDKIEMRGDRAEMSDFPLYLNTVAGGLDRRDQTIGGFSFVVKIYAVPVVEIIGQLLYLLGRYGFNAQFSDCL